MPVSGSSRRSALLSFSPWQILLTRHAPLSVHALACVHFRVIVGVHPYRRPLITSKTHLDHCFAALLHKNREVSCDRATRFLHS